MNPQDPQNTNPPAAEQPAVVMDGFSAPAPTPVAPAAAGVQAPADGPKASKNPFRHIWHGTKNFLVTNFAAGLLVTLLTLLVNIGLAVLAIALVLHYISNLTAFGSSGNIGRLLGGFVLFVVIYFAVQAFLNQAFARVILTGARHQKETFRGALSMAARRYGLAFRAYGLIVLAIAGFVVLAGILSSTGSGPGLGIILFIAGLIAAIILALRLQYLGFVIVDEEQPGSARTAMKSSAAVWKRSQWAAVLYWLVIIVAYFVVAFATGGFKSSSSTSSSNDFKFDSNGNLISSPNSDTGSLSNGKKASLLGGAAAGVIGGAAIATVVNALVLSGLADIYNEVQGERDIPAEPVVAGTV